jgi:hypothetical protein
MDFITALYQGDVAAQRDANSAAQEKLHKELIQKDE